MSMLPMPPYPTGSVAQQCAQQYSYLFQMAQQLNLALDQMESSGEKNAVKQRAAIRGKETEATQKETYETLKSLIVKTAETVQRRMDQITAQMNESYVAASDFGDYVAQLSAYLEANPEAITQYYGFYSELKADTAAVDAAFSDYKVDTEGYIRTGIVYYDGAVPVYGVAVGQNLSATETDGERVVDPNNFRAVFTAAKLSFWQDSTEVAYVSNNRLYIQDITVLGGLELGDWKLEEADGLVFRWIGG